MTRAPDRAAPGRLLELVGPAAVEGHRPAAEPARDRVAGLGLEIGIVDQEDRDLAGEVDVAEIVPAPLGRGDAIADEDQGRALDRHGLRVAHRAHIDVVRRPQRGRPAAPDDLELCPLRHARADQRDHLGPAAILAARLEAERAELLDQVGDGPGLPLGAGGAALELVRGQLPGPFGEALRIDWCPGGGGGRIGGLRPGLSEGDGWQAPKRRARETGSSCGRHWRFSAG